MRRLVPLLLPVMVLVLGCFYTYRLELPETRSWPAADIAYLTASARNGHIHVTAAADTLITCRITRWCYGRDSSDAARALENVVVKDTVVSNRLSIKAEMPGGTRSYGTHYDITVPDSTPLTLFTSNGSVSLTNIASGISASTSNADIAALNTKGSLNLSTSNGNVKVQVHRGNIAVSTSNGAIECDLAELGATESAGLVTSKGKVTLYLPADVSATFDASTSNADVTIYGFGMVSYEKSERAHKRGRIGSGASIITIVTSDAEILIRAR